MKAKSAELCAGYNGLGMAVEQVLNTETAWFSEYDAAPSKILAHHYPGIPNYGDMTQIKWAPGCPDCGYGTSVYRHYLTDNTPFYWCNICSKEWDIEIRHQDPDADRIPEPATVIAGGTPCQDLSAAGKRRGMTEGTRSNLWVIMREGVAIQRPEWVVWENVRGAYSACADSEMGQCPGCLDGRESHRPFLRALGRVLGDLSDLGYDCEWRGLRASDVGAPHARFRVFVLARRRDAWNPDGQDVERRERTGHEAVREAARAGQDRGASEIAAYPGGEGRRESDVPAGIGAESQDGPGVADESDQGHPRPERADTADADDLGHHGAGSARGGRPESAHGRDTVADTGSAALRWLSGESLAEETGPEGRHGSGDPHGERATGERGEATPDNHDDGRERIAERDGEPETRGEVQSRDDTDGRLAPDSEGDGWDEGRTEPAGILGGSDTPLSLGTNWGDYEPAIRRWEQVLGRPAPRPTEPTGRNGAERLSPRFTEWMMGLPDGWVTDPAIMISHNDQLKACGNGVVTQQAVAALFDMHQAFMARELVAA